MFRERAVPREFPRVAAIAAADVSGDGIIDVVGVAADGDVTRLSTPRERIGFEAARVTRVRPPPALTPGTARLLVADLDNNGAGDLMISGPAGSRSFWPRPAALSARRGGPLPGGITSAADLDGDGRLELVARAATAPRVVRVKGQKTTAGRRSGPRAVTATGDQRINSFGIGGEIEVRTGLHAQKQVIAAPVVHFGLGEASVPRWRGSSGPTASCSRSSTSPRIPHRRPASG